jgi:3-methyladenine DNA glycosylase AlkD
MRRLLFSLRDALKAVADPARAPQMQAYMKSAMPYLGVPMPLLRKVCRQVFADLELPGRIAWQDQVLELWRDAKYREERYAALTLCADKRARPFHEPAAMKMYEEIIVTGAWWDFVDDAAHRVGDILAKHPARIAPLMLTWSRSDNLWKRRTSITCQLLFKTETDLALLYACIEPSLGSKEFFLQKAIGWALRQHAWTDPQEVIRYVRANEARLAALSRREALKNISPPVAAPIG